MKYLSSSIWLSIMPSKSICVVTNDKISFFLMAEYYSIWHKGIYTIPLSLHLLTLRLFLYLSYWE